MQEKQDIFHLLGRFFLNNFISITLQLQNIKRSHHWEFLFIKRNNASNCCPGCTNSVVWNPVVWNPVVQNPSCTCKPSSANPSGMKCQQWPLQCKKKKKRFTRNIIQLSLVSGLVVTTTILDIQHYKYFCLWMTKVQYDSVVIFSWKWYFWDIFG